MKRTRIEILCYFVLRMRINLDFCFHGGMVFSGREGGLKAMLPSMYFLYINSIFNICLFCKFFFDEDDCKFQMDWTVWEHCFYQCCGSCHYLLIKSTLRCWMSFRSALSTRRNYLSDDTSNSFISHVLERTLFCQRTLWCVLFICLFTWTTVQPGDTFNSSVCTWTTILPSDTWNSSVGVRGGTFWQVIRLNSSVWCTWRIILPDDASYSSV